MRHRQLDTTGMAVMILVVLLALIVTVVPLYIILSKHVVSGAVANPNACVNSTFSAGSSGGCVSDLQNLVNLAAFGIDQPSYIKVSGQYDSATTTAVKTFQKNAQRNVTGTVDHADWQALCQAEDPPSWWTVAATDAGCQP